MSANTRLASAGLLLIMSAVYGVIVAEDPDLASALAAGYIAILLTVLAIINFWKKP